MSSGERRTTIVLIGGASGVGKTTLAKALEERGVAVYKKIHDLALEIAKEMGVDAKIALEQMDDSVVIKRFIDLSRGHRCVVSDLHFAIQPKTDTVFLTEGKIKDEKLLATEKFVPAFEASELSAITDHGMVLVPILITCDIDSLIRRRSLNPAQIPRSLSREIVQLELTAELEIYLSLVRQLGFEPQIFVNADGQFDKLKDEVISFLELRKEK